MNRETVSTDAAPKAIGPYVQGIKTNGFLYTSGQIALDPKTGELIKGASRPGALEIGEVDQ